MLMIPLPFMVALAAAMFLVRELLVDDSGQRRGWFVAFLALLVFQEVLIGLRFGYGFERLREIQPLTAALLPPLAYLSFRRPALTPQLALHLLPFVIIVVLLVAFRDFLDTALAFNHLFYLIALARIGWQGSDALAWVEIRRANAALLLLWLVCGLLVISGLADAVIAYDFWTTSGANTSRIVGWLSAAGVLSAAAGFIAYRLFSWDIKPAAAGDSARDVEIFERLNALMESEKLFMDPDINLSRIARRLTLPAREVSRAVNAQTVNNVSQYVNRLRIEEACRLLSQTDMPITQIVFASGFNTKSNFNREFGRVKNNTPSEWRSANRVRDRQD